MTTITLFRVKLEGGEYISGDSIQTTKDRFKALTYRTKAERNLKLCENKGTVEEVTFKDVKPCVLGDVSFGFGDTYSLTNVNGYIIHETPKYIWTIKLDAVGSVLGGTVQKHLRKDLGTRCFVTGQGIQASK